MNLKRLPASVSQPARPNADFQEAPRKGRLILGVDPGTTRWELASAAATASGYQFPPSVYQQKKPEPEIFKEHPNYNHNGNTCPSTSLYFSDPTKLPVTGHRLKALLENTDPTAVNVERLFTNWKTLFQPNPPTEMMARLRRIGMKPEDLFRAWVQVQYQELISEDPDHVAKLRDMFDLSKFDIEIVVAVPPGRTASAHAQVRKAFVQDPIKEDQVSLVSEPECLFRSWACTNFTSEHYKIGDRFIVADNGGGTSCIVTYILLELDPPRFRHEFDAESVTWAAETISDNFEELIKDKLPVDYPNRAWVISRMRRIWDETHKYTFDGRSSHIPIVIGRPGAPEIQDAFSYDEVTNCFEQCVRRLIEGIERQRIQGETPDYLILGGGLSHNDYVRMRMRKAFGSSMKIRYVTAEQGHVAKGAVLTRLNTEFIASHPLERSVGVETWVPLTPELRQANPGLDIWDDPDTNNVWDDPDWDTKFCFVIQWIAKKGEEVSGRHEHASEATYEGARQRTFPYSEADPTFCDSIITVDYDPGDVEFTIVSPNGQLVSQAGQILPDPIEEVTIAWKPNEMDISLTQLADLELMRKGRKCRRLRKLHYSIQTMLALGKTTYWIKAWNLTRKSRSTAAPRISEPVVCRALCSPKQISESLARSFELGNGTGTKVTDLVQPEESLPSPASFPTDNIENQRGPTSPKADSDSHPPSTGAEESITIIYNTNGKSQPPNDGRQGGFTTPPSWDRDATAAANENTKNARIKYKGAPVGTLRKNWGCWTCLFRGDGCKSARPVCRECKISGLICDDCKLEKPSCSRCSQLDLVCEFGCPSWWHDSKLRYYQRCLNLDLLKQRKDQIRPKRRRVRGGFTKSLTKVDQPVLTNSDSLNLVSTAQAATAAPEKLHPVVESSIHQQVHWPSGLKRPRSPDSDEDDIDDEPQLIIVDRENNLTETGRPESQGTLEPGPIISHRSIMMDSDTETPEPYPIINHPSIMLDLFNISDRHRRSETARSV